MTYPIYEKRQIAPKNQLEYYLKIIDQIINIQKLKN